MNTLELTQVYNNLAVQLGLSTIAPWKKAKAELETRIAKLDAEVHALEQVRREAATTSSNRPLPLTPLKPDNAPRLKPLAPKTEPEPAPFKPVKINPEFEAHLRKLLNGNVIPSQAFRQTLQAFPGTSRIVAKHSAAAAGMNAKTARNLFDRIRGER